MPQSQPTPGGKDHFHEPKNTRFPLRLTWINMNKASHIGVDLNKPSLDENVDNIGPLLNLDLNMTFPESQPSPTPPPSVSQPNSTQPSLVSQPSPTLQPSIFQPSPTQSPSVSQPNPTPPPSV